MEGLISTGPTPSSFLYRARFRGPIAKSEVVGIGTSQEILEDVGEDLEGLEEAGGDNSEALLKMPKAIPRDGKEPAPILELLKKLEANPRS